VNDNQYLMTTLGYLGIVFYVDYGISSQQHNMQSSFYFRKSLL